MIQGKLPIFILKNRNCRRLRLAKDKKKEGEAMRIGTYNMISQIYGNTGTKKTKMLPILSHFLPFFNTIVSFETSANS